MPHGELEAHGGCGEKYGAGTFRRSGTMGAGQAAGSGSPGLVSSESAAGFGGLRGLGRLRARRA